MLSNHRRTALIHYIDTYMRVLIIALSQPCDGAAEALWYKEKKIENMGCSSSKH
jgi:hypothetical protein